MKINQLKILKDSFFVIIFSNLSNVASLLYQIFMGRNISSSDYGLLISFYSVLGILSLPSVIIPFIVNNFLTEKNNQYEKDYFLVNIFYLCGFILIVEIFFIFLFKDTFFSLLKFDNLRYLTLLLTLQCLTFLLAILMGIYTSKSMYIHFSIIGPSSLYFRFILLLICIYFFSKVNVDIILQINILAVFLSIVIAFYFSKTNFFKLFFQKYEFENGILKILKFAAPTFFIFLAIIFLQNVDAIIVRKILSKTDSGLISSTIVLGKIPLFLFSALIYVIFPEIKKNIDKIKDFFSPKKFLFFLLIVIFISTSYSLLIYSFGHEIIDIIFKKSFENVNFIFTIISFYYFQVSLFLMLTSCFLTDINKSLFYAYMLIFLVIIGFCGYSFLYLKSAETLFISLNIMVFVVNIIALFYAFKFFTHKK